MSDDEGEPFIGSRPASPTTSHIVESGQDGSNNDDSATWSPVQASGRLYVSHTLSTANSRVFEFGSVLYLAAIFPNTLMPMSVYAMARGASAVIFSSLVGRYIDTENRLRVVRMSIIIQRVAVAASCVILLVFLSDMIHSKVWTIGAMALLITLACAEKLASMMNTIAVEKDWVVTMAGNDSNYLRVMNSQMRRIDLVCKLIGPFVIGLVDGPSTKAAVIVNLGMNITSIPLEYICIAQVYAQVPSLQHQLISESSNVAQSNGASTLQRVKNDVVYMLWKAGKDMRLYFRHDAFMPSFACALLYFTVLSFSGQMVTFLLSAGYTSAQVATARTFSVSFEVLATWAGPWLVGKIGPTRAGLWFSSWQAGFLLLGVSLFWAYSDRALVSSSALVGGTILSRLGLWGFDLCAQILVQEDVDEDSRGAFSAVEAAWQNIFELCSYTSTIILSSPDQFGYPVSMSVFAVLCAWALYTRFVKARRGHLLHWSACLVGLEKGTRRAESPLLSSQRRPRFDA